jgi:hypothetical protein
MSNELSGIGAPELATTVALLVAIPPRERTHQKGTEKNDEDNSFSTVQHSSLIKKWAFRADGEPDPR